MGLCLTRAAFATFNCSQHPGSENDSGLFCPCALLFIHKASCKEGQERRENVGLYGLAVTGCLVFFSDEHVLPWTGLLSLQGSYLALYQHHRDFFLSALPHGQLLPNIQVGASNSLLHPSNLRTSAYFQQFSALTLLPSLIPVLHHEPQLLGSPIFPI